MKFLILKGKATKIIYRWEHYNAREEFDDCFYDCTYGEYSKGHKRMINN